MICFLTSLPFDRDTGEFNPANGFTDKLRRCVSQPCRALFICSDPYDEDNNIYAAGVRQSLENAGIGLERISVLDGRNTERAEELINDSNLVILGGGHVPTQNRFFDQIELRSLLNDYDGVIIGISAGSMNSADIVYAQPELDGEAIDPGYQRFLTGLGLTKTMLLPHYYACKDDTLDGLRIIEDITLPDSMGKTFYFITLSSDSVRLWKQI